MRKFRSLRALSFTILALIVATGAAWGQTDVRPGFNLFTVAQDVEIGKQSVVEVERQLPMLSQQATLRYVADLGARLAAQAPGAKYNYKFKVANLSDVNAFALPGGFVYIHRGLLEKVRSEGELAGVMAHEIAHVALRHSTNQASKAYLAQAGIGILGGLFGGKTQTTTGQIIGAVGGFGLNALFLKYSRSAETQADIVGAQIMAKAGYDPMEMVRFFEAMRLQAGSDPSKVAQFLSDHPAPANREARVRQEVALLGTVRSVSPIGSIVAVQRDLGHLSPAPSSAQLASGQTPAPSQPTQTTTETATISVERPSTLLRTFRQRQGLFELQYPDNWSAYAPSQGYGVTIAPRGGFVATSGGQQNLVCGLVVNHFVPFDGAVGTRYRDPLGSLFGRTPLEEASSDLVRQVMHANPHLNVVAGSERRRTLSGDPSFSVLLSGLSPVTGLGERVSVATRRLPDKHVVYMLLVAQAKDYAMLAPASERMVRSLRVNGGTTHL
jgi:Zn-dependent protease with chaperone function